MTQPRRPGLLDVGGSAGSCRRFLCRRRRRNLLRPPIIRDEISPDYVTFRSGCSDRPAQWCPRAIRLERSASFIHVPSRGTPNSFNAVALLAPIRDTRLSPADHPSGYQPAGDHSCRSGIGPSRPLAPTVGPAERSVEAQLRIARGCQGRRSQLAPAHQSGPGYVPIRN